VYHAGEQTFNKIYLDNVNMITLRLRQHSANLYNNGRGHGYQYPYSILRLATCLPRPSTCIVHFGACISLKDAPYCFKQQARPSANTLQKRITLKICHSIRHATIPGKYGILSVCPSTDVNSLIYGLLAVMKIRGLQDKVCALEWRQLVALQR
jgi:hypothetical protein